MPFTFERTAIPGILLIEPHIVADGRGFLMETYKRSEFARAGIDEPFVQENHSRSQRGVLRGLHYQRAPQAQSKLIRVLSGEIFDVAVDIRPDSPTSGRWVGVTLSAANRRMMYVPHWCAHGFCVTSENAEVVYLTTTEYNYSPAIFSPEDIAEYVRVNSNPGSIRAGFQYYATGLREDTVNLKNATQKLTIPVLAWGGAALLRDIVPQWKAVAENVTGGMVEECGHFIPEEKPQFVIEKALEFFAPLAKR